MRELFDTFDERGEPFGLVARDVVHRLGLWHRASNVFLFKSDGKLVVQRRQVGKDVCPGAWDLSIAEHLKPGEDYRTAAARGLREELGLEQVELEAIGGVVAAKLEIAEQGVKDYEFQQCFRGVSDADLHIESKEIAEYRVISLSELKGQVDRSPNDFTPWFLDRARELGLFD